MPLPFRPLGVDATSGRAIRDPNSAEQGLVINAEFRSDDEPAQNLVK